MESLEQKRMRLLRKTASRSILIEAEGIKANQFEILERISGFTAEQKKNFIEKFRKRACT